LSNKLAESRVARKNDKPPVNAGVYAQARICIFANDELKTMKTPFAKPEAGAS
jgi:hypothetical protein